MMKKNIQKTIIYTTVVMAALVLFSAGMMFWLGGGESDTEDTSAIGTESDTSGLYLIMEHDTAGESILFYSYENKTEVRYTYNFSTKFANKYGDDTTASRFVPGKVVELERKDMFGHLTKVQMSDEVWEQEKVRRFSVNEEQGVFTIGSNNYSIKDKVVVFSKDTYVGFDALTENDILSVVGMGSQLLSVRVTTGHGNLALKNTELFDGSMLKLNDNIFAEVTKDMVMELPEGTYTLVVANDGWGGSREIVISRGETTEVDLDTMKGEGRKKGMITFLINEEDVRVYLDYEKIDHTKPVEITYGTHTLEVRAVGYASWKKYLVVNSAEATIMIELEEAEEEEETEEESEKSSEKESEKPSEKESEKTSETETK